MCGIVGAIGHKITQHQLKRAVLALRHRGPDGSGFLLDEAGDVGLGHARLSIIDLGTGAQPLYSEDNDIAIVCNGEIYNFERIRDDLKQRGHVFRSGSDSEVIIHLYQEYGEDFVHQLRGEFAFLLYDSRNNKLLAVRDRFGIKPLFYNAQDGRYLFGSEAKALFATGLLKPRIDVVALRDYLSGVIPDSIFEGVRSVPPGCMLISDTASHTHELKQYWDLDLPTDASLPQDADNPIHATNVRQQIDDAIRLRLRADVPVGVYLSGGIDSAIVAAVAAKHFPGTLKVFTIAFPGDHAFNEIDVARRMAEKIGAEFHSVQCDDETLLANMEDCLWVTELPFVNFHGVGKYILSRLARQHVTVVLTGEGSDEVFLGYVYFQEGKGAMSDQIQNRLKARSIRPTKRSKRVADALGFVPIPEHALTFTPLQQRVIAGAFRREHRAKLLGSHPLERIKQRMDRKTTDPHTHARKVQYFWIKSMLAPYLLSMLGDRVEMGHSIEGRTPFLDHHLWEMARTIPDAAKIYNGVEKHVLREAFRDDLTDELYRRAKWPYSAPPLRVEPGHSKTLDKLIAAYLSKEAIERSGIFNYGAVRRIRLLAKLLFFDSLLRKRLHIALIFILTVQILEHRFVQNFEAALQSDSDPLAELRNAVAT